MKRHIIGWQTLVKLEQPDGLGLGRFTNDDDDDDGTSKTFATTHVPLASGFRAAPETGPGRVTLQRRIYIATVETFLWRVRAQSAAALQVFIFFRSFLLECLT